MANLTKEEEKTLKEISGTYYMRPIVAKINAWVYSLLTCQIFIIIKFNYIYENLNRARVLKKILWYNLLLLPVRWIAVLDQLRTILENSKTDVEQIVNQRIDARIASKEIDEKAREKSKSQTMVSIAGHAFSNSVIYIFLHNKICGNLPSEIYITSQPSTIPNFRESMYITVQDETQKPDMDIVIYALSQDKKSKGRRVTKATNYILLSLKTSLRERAAQTYKWKLLMEVALCSPELREKYDISYTAEAIPIVCFATTNFYDEINNPQQRGMLKFFDRAFIAKEIETEQKSFIYPLSNLIPFAIDQLTDRYIQLSLF